MDVQVGTSSVFLVMILKSTSLYKIDTLNNTVSLLSAPSPILHARRGRAWLHKNGEITENLRPVLDSGVNRELLVAQF